MLMGFLTSHPQRVSHQETHLRQIEVDITLAGCSTDTGWPQFYLHMKQLVTLKASWHLNHPAVGVVFPGQCIAIVPPLPHLYWIKYERIGSQFFLGIIKV